MRHGLYAGLYKRTVNGYPHAVVKFLHINTYFGKLLSDGLKVLGDNIFDKHISLCGSSRNHICACLDLIGDNGVGGAFKLLYASYLDNVGACAHNICAH